jgi:hypothetical protein
MRLPPPPNRSTSRMIIIIGLDTEFQRYTRAHTHTHIYYIHVYRFMDSFFFFVTLKPVTLVQMFGQKKINCVKERTTERFPIIRYRTRH